MLKKDFPPQYKQAVLDNICRGLFGKIYQSNNRFLQQMIDHNNRLLRKRSNGFSYLGKHWGNTHLYLPLHDSLKPAMGDHVKQLTEFQTQRETPVKAFVVNAFNACQTPADIFLILPESLHQYLPPEVKQHARLTEPVLTDEEIEAFNQKNADKLAALKESLLLVIITQ